MILRRGYKILKVAEGGVMYLMWSPTDIRALNIEESLKTDKSLCVNVRVNMYLSNFELGSQRWPQQFSVCK